jgi:hypothetical protein
MENGPLGRTCTRTNALLRRVPARASALGYKGKWSLDRESHPDLLCFKQPCRLTTLPSVMTDLLELVPSA